MWLWFEPFFPNLPGRLLVGVRPLRWATLYLLGLQYSVLTQIREQTRCAKIWRNYTGFFLLKNIWDSRRKSWGKWGKLDREYLMSKMSLNCLAAIAGTWWRVQGQQYWNYQKVLSTIWKHPCIHHWLKSLYWRIRRWCIHPSVFGDCFPRCWGETTFSKSFIIRSILRLVAAVLLQCEALFLYGLMLLTIDTHIDGIVRERLLVSFNRYTPLRRDTQSSFDEVCKLLMDTGCNSPKRPQNYPEDYFKLFKLLLLLPFPELTFIFQESFYQSYLYWDGNWAAALRRYLLTSARVFSTEAS